MKISHSRSVSLAMEMVRTALADPYIYGIRFHRGFRRLDKSMNAHIRVIESDITAKKESATIMSFTEKLVIMVPFANPDIRRPDQAKEFELPVLVQGTIDTAESTGVLDITFITRKINRRMPMRVSCHIGTRGQICTTSSVEEEYFRGLPIIGNFHQPDPFEMK